MRLYLDISTAPLPNAADYVDAESISAPSNWKDEAKIAAYKAEKLAERLDGCALDLDLARITGIGIWVAEASEPHITVAREQAEEIEMLEDFADVLRSYDEFRLTSYNGASFDWPMLTRRAKYLKVKTMPWINTDRYRSPHRDLLAELSDRDPSRRRPLSFYAKRLGAKLTKPLSGAEEAKVPETGRWDDLVESLRHDLVVMRAITHWLDQ